jgi:hypothetical protein
MLQVYVLIRLERSDRDLIRMMEPAVKMLGTLERAMMTRLDGLETKVLRERVGDFARQSEADVRPIRAKERSLEVEPGTGYSNLAEFARLKQERSQPSPKFETEGASDEYRNDI